MTLNQLTLGKEGAAAKFLEFLEAAEPGSEIKITLDNGVSKLDGKWLIDESLADRTAGRLQMEGGQDLGGCTEGDESKDEPEAADTKKPSADEPGAAALAVLAPSGKG